jgi:hypothetical protein
MTLISNLVALLPREVTWTQVLLGSITTVRECFPILLMWLHNNGSRQWQQIAPV